MKDRVCVVTGANSGVGFEAARSLARLGAEVVLVCRDRGKGSAALESIASSAPEATLRLEVTDLASLDQVRALGRTLANDYPGIDLLVNNAGVYRASFERTEDGFEMTMGVNHLSHFLLTHLLLEPLKAVSGRVLNVGSEAHRRGRLDPEKLGDALRGGGGYDGWRVYSDSKLANVLFTAEFARRHPFQEVSTSVVHPGVLSTRIWNQNRNLLSLLMNLVKPFMKPPSVGGDAVVALAGRPAAEVHGRYFDLLEEASPSPLGRDEGLAAQLWETSRSLVGLDRE